MANNIIKKKLIVDDYILSKDVISTQTTNNKVY